MKKPEDLQLQNRDDVVKGEQSAQSAQSAQSTQSTQSAQSTQSTQSTPEFEGVVLNGMLATMPETARRRAHKPKRLSEPVHVEKQPFLTKVYSTSKSSSLAMTIPPELRAALGWQIGDDIAVWKDGDVLVMRKFKMEIRADELFIS